MDLTEHKKIKILNEFRTQLINFLDEIIDSSQWKQILF